MLTLNQIISQIKTLANAHYQIAEVGVGTIAELQGKPDRSYPLLWLSNEGGYLEDNYKVDSIRLTMFGRVITGEEGQDDDASELEVLSDMQLILLDFLNYFHQQHGQEYVTSKTATLEHFTERTNDRTAGYSTVLELKQFYDWNKCQIPESGASIPPTVDGLTLYDFCDQSVIDRLTPAQIACLEAEFGNCADATVQLNGTTVGTVASGATGDFDVLQDGSPIGSWNGSAFIIPGCPVQESLSVAVSNATPDYNGTVTITATPSGITPTSYTFLIACQADGDAYVTQASNVLVWTVNRVGAIKVSVTATDGVDTVGATADLTVTDPLNYATKLVDYDMRNNITLVGFEIDIVGDSSGNGHDVTATTSANRAYYDVYSDRFDTGSSPKDLRNLASNPLSGAGSFTMFAKFQKQASNATNQRLITFGASGAGFLVGLTSALGGDIVVGSNNFAQYTSATVVPQAGTPIAVVKNGTANYDIYANGSITVPVATGGTVPATLPVANGIYLGTQNGSFGFTGAFQRIVIFDGALTATQIAAVNERIKVLHP